MESDRIAGWWFVMNLLKLSEMTSLQRLLFLNGAGGGLTEYDVTGNPVSFNTNVSKPLRQLLIPFSPVQEGSGDPSPSNVRPITGWTGVNVTRTGRNLIDPAKIDASSANFVWYYKADGFLFKSGETYTLSVGKDVSSIRIVDYVDNSIVYAQNPTGNLRTATFTPSSDVRGAIRLWSSGLTAEGLDAQLELGDTASPYEEYVGTTIPVTFPATGKNLIQNKKVSSGNNIYLGTDDYKANDTHSITLQPGTYTLSVETYDGSTTNLYIAEVGLSDTFGRVVNSKKMTFTVNETIQARIWVYKASYSQIGDSAITWFQLESGSSDTSYEPYTNTAYGGTLDLTTGVLTVEYGWFADDGQDANKWSAGESSGMLRVILSAFNIGRLPKASSTDNLRVNYFKATGTTQGWAAFIGSTSNFLAYIPLTVCQNKDAWLSYLAEHPLEIYYELDEPYEVHLTPQQINTLIGDNVIFTDTNGENTIKYFKKG